MLVPFGGDFEAEAFGSAHGAHIPCPMRVSAGRPSDLRISSRRRVFAVPLTLRVAVGAWILVTANRRCSLDQLVIRQMDGFGRLDDTLGRQQAEAGEYVQLLFMEVGFLVAQVLRRPGVTGHAQASNLVGYVVRFLLKDR